MKYVLNKIIALVGAIILTFPCWAQDIIVTNDAQKIEAKILEVSRTEIKYKEKSNLNGPTFILETKEISSIIYSNGQVKVYNQPTKNEDLENHEIASAADDAPVNVAPTTDESTAQILLLSGLTWTVQITEMNSNYVAYIKDGKPYMMPASQIDKVTFLQTGQVRDYHQPQSMPYEAPDNSKRGSTNSVIVKSNGYYYVGEKKMTKDQYLHFIHTNCHAAWESYKKGGKLWRAGWGLFGAGMGSLAIGVPVAIIGYTNAVKTQSSTSGAYGMSIDLGTAVAGTVFVGLGACFTIASIPCLAIGANKRNNSHSIYNKQCASHEETLNFNIQASQNGIGLALAF